MRDTGRHTCKCLRELIQIHLRSCTGCPIRNGTHAQTIGTGPNGCGLRRKVSEDYPLRVSAQRAIVPHGHKRPL